MMHVPEIAFSDAVLTGWLLLAVLAVIFHIVSLSSCLDGIMYPEIET